MFADQVTRKMKEAVQRSMEKVQKEHFTEFVTVFEKYAAYLENEYKND